LLPVKASAPGVADAGSAGSSAPVPGVAEVLVEDAGDVVVVVLAGQSRAGAMADAPSAVTVSSEPPARPRVAWGVARSARSIAAVVFGAVLSVA
jgi:hypothetical protein